MRRFIRVSMIKRVGMLLASITMALTVFAAAPADKASAHSCGDSSWQWGSCFAVCKYIAKAYGYVFPPWYVDTTDTWSRHYNGAHILTCAIRLDGAGSNSNTICFHYVIETGSLSQFYITSKGNCFV